MSAIKMLKIMLREARQSRDYFQQKIDLIEMELRERGAEVPDER